MTVVRRLVTSCEVWAAWGAVVGYAMITAALWSALIWTGAANATPGVVRNAWSTFSMVAASCDDDRGAANTRGPLNPGPNPSANRSYAWRVVNDVGPLLASVKARRIENNG